MLWVGVAGMQQGCLSDRQAGDRGPLAESTWRNFTKYLLSIPRLSFVMYLDSESG
jgi:hypothetical protein